MCEAEGRTCLSSYRVNRIRQDTKTAMAAGGLIGVGKLGRGAAAVAALWLK